MSEVIGTIKSDKTVKYYDYEHMKKDMINFYSVGKEIKPKWTNEKIKQKMLKEVKEYFQDKFKKNQKYRTTKDIDLKNGNAVKKGTTFIIDNKINNKYNIRFLNSENDKTIHEFSEKEIRTFTKEEPKEAIWLSQKPQSFKRESIKTSYVLPENEKKSENIEEKTVQMEEQMEEKNTIEEDKAVEEQKAEEQKEQIKILKILETVNRVKLDLFQIKGDLDFRHLEKINKALCAGICVSEIDNGKILDSKEILKDMKNDLEIKNSERFIKNTATNMCKLYKLNLFKKNNTKTLKQFAKTYGMAAGYKLDINEMKDFEKGCIEGIKTGKTDILQKVLKAACKNVEPSKDLIKNFTKQISRGIERC